MNRAERPQEPVRVTYIETLFDSDRYSNGVVMRGATRWWWELYDRRGVVRAHGVADTEDSARQALLGAAHGGRR